MILFKKIKWKNFLSAGNQFNEITLNEKPMTIIVGKNGAGKSSIIDALTYGLFGKSFKKLTNSQLINSINQKDMMVEIFFSIGKREYHIKRGLKPKVFEIYCDGKLLDQDAAARDYQKYLETTILKLNYKSFTQIVVLGSGSFVPFMQLTSNDRRIIIEDILDIQIFSVMKSLLKERMSEVNNDLNNTKMKKGHTETQIELHEKYIKDMAVSKEKVISEIEEEIEKIKNVISLNELKIKNINQDIDELNKNVLNGELKREIKELEGLIIKIENSLEKTVKSYTFLKSNDTCISCEQDITETYKKGALVKKEDKIEEYKQALLSLTGKSNEVKAKEEHNSKIKKDIEIKNRELIELKSNNRLYKSNLNNYVKKKEDKTESKSSLDEELVILQELRDNIVDLNKKRIDIEEKICYYNRINILLQDGGIKTKIIKKYLPVINNRVNKYLKEMDFFVNFYLDENFNETIKSRYRDVFSYSSFSEGEKQRIDVALLLTWRDIAAMRNSVNINLLIMDEIFDSSLDQDGIDDVMKLFNNLTNTNLFVVSHRGDVLEDKFSSKIYVDKKQNFSTFERE